MSNGARRFRGLLLTGSMCMVSLSSAVVQPASAASGQVILRDEFSGRYANGRLWSIPTWRYSGDGTFIGRTQFRCSQNAPLPPVSKGHIHIPLETYNPTGHSFYGTDLIGRKSFSMGKGIDITVRAKIDSPVQRGIVGGIFLYGLKPASSSLHDEIDFELVGNDAARAHTNIYANEPLGVGNPSAVRYMSGSVSGYHLYRIQWLPTRVSWYVDGRLVRTATGSIPKGPMRLHINMWAPGSDWSDAYYAGIDPTNSLRRNRIFNMSVDSVVVVALK